MPRLLSRVPYPQLPWLLQLLLFRQLLLALPQLLRQFGIACLPLGSQVLLAAGTASLVLMTTSISLQHQQCSPSTIRRVWNGPQSTILAVLLMKPISSQFPKNRSGRNEEGCTAVTTLRLTRGISPPTLGSTYGGI